MSFLLRLVIRASRWGLVSGHPHPAWPLNMHLAIMEAVKYYNLLDTMHVQPDGVNSRTLLGFVFTSLYPLKWGVKTKPSVVSYCKT